MEFIKPIIGLFILGVIGFLPSMIVISIGNRFIYPAYQIPKRAALFGTLIAFLVCLFLSLLSLLSFTGFYIMLCFIFTGLVSLVFFIFKYVKYKSTENNNNV